MTDKPPKGWPFPTYKGIPLVRWPLGDKPFKQPKQPKPVKPLWPDAPF